MSDPYKSIHLIRRELEARGFTAEKIREADKNYLIFTKDAVQWRSRTAYVDYPFVSPSLKRLSTDKNQAYAYAASQGVAVANTVTVTSPGEEVWGSVASMVPVIVKPADRGGSRGLTRDIDTPDGLRLAIDTALTFSEKALIQRQFMGEELRFTCVNGTVRSAVLRSPASLKGDGEHTVEWLLAVENEARTKLSEKLSYMNYPLLQGDLISQQLQMDQVIEKDVTLQLNESSMISGGASVYDVLARVHPTYIAIVEQLVQSLDAVFLVVDFMIADMSQPADDKNYIFLEFNTAPALKLYYSIRDGQQYDIVPILADMIVADISTAH